MKKTGKIALEGLLFYAYHGTHPHEQSLGNQFEVDISVTVDFDNTAFSDDLSGTINYEELYALAKEALEKEKKKLMEPIAYSLAQRILDTFDKALESTVIISKLAPPIQGACKKARVEIRLVK